jgi:hypothetical protein
MVLGVVGASAASLISTSDMIQVIETNDGKSGKKECHDARHTAGAAAPTYMYM